MGQPASPIKFGLFNGNQLPSSWDDVYLLFRRSINTILRYFALIVNTFYTIFMQSCVVIILNYVKYFDFLSLRYNVEHDIIRTLFIILVWKRGVRGWWGWVNFHVNLTCTALVAICVKSVFDLNPLKPGDVYSYELPGSISVQIEDRRHYCI